MGVSLALKLLENALASLDSIRSGGGRLLTLGPIIHNPRVTEEYKAQGVLCVEDPMEVQSGDYVLIRAHGIARSIEEQLISRGATVLDATCPRVKDAQLSICDMHNKNGGKLLLFGEADHPEVRGLVSYADGDAIVFADVEALSNLELVPEGKYYLASQTTQDKKTFAQVKARLSHLLKHPFPVLETICGATKRDRKNVV